MTKSGKKIGDCFVGMEAYKQGVVVLLTLSPYADLITAFVQKGHRLWIYACR